DHAANPTTTPTPQRDPIFLALGSPSPESHVLSTLRRIPPASLNDALLILPFAHLPALFTFLALFFRRKMQPELAWRVAYFLLQAHMSQIVASGGLRKELQEILEASGDWVQSQKQVFGFNLAGLDIMGLEARERESGTGWIDGAEEEEELDLTKGKKKRGFASLA
ncbi:beta transducin, partial [Oleoguttula sp. CCFEE 5521]